MTAARTCLLRTTAFLFLGTMLFASPAYAHPGHGESFGHGLLHPFAGIDHLLAMIAVGLLAARVAGWKRWLLPASFVGFMLVGGLVGLAGASMEIAAIEWVIAASVLVFGVMTFGLPRVPAIASALIIAAFAVFHGYAHIAEMGDAAPIEFTAGMMLGTALLHAIGLAGGLALERAGKGNVRYIRVAGAGLALTFLVVLGIG